MTLINTARNGKYRKGARIVLTSDTVMMSDFGNDPFRAFYSTFPQKLAKKSVAKHFRPKRNRDGTAKFAIYGLRKVESILQDRFGEKDVVTCYPTDLERFVGPDTKIVGVSTMDPMGLAYVSTTYNSIIGFGGVSLTRHAFEELLKNPALQKYRPKLIVGGAGSWQIDEANRQKKLGIDVIAMGDGDKDLVPLIEDILGGRKVPPIVKMKRADTRTEKLAIIKRPATFGVVEITRGCGRNCQFCSPTNRMKYSIPIKDIMKEVKVNIDGGNDTIFAVTEDIFLYESLPKFVPNRKKLVEMFSSIAGYPGVNTIHLSHAALAPVVHDERLMPELTEVLLPKSSRRLRGESYITVECGIETGSRRLMKKYMRGKALPYSVDNWHEIVVEGIRRMNENRWIPLCTIMTGLPDETEEDVLETHELLDKMKDLKLFYVPLLFIPLEGAILQDATRVQLKHISELQWEIITRAWRRNIEIWRHDLSTFYRILGFFMYGFYFSWKHGSKSLPAALDFLGMPKPFMGTKSIGGCDKDLCDISSAIIVPDKEAKEILKARDEKDRGIKASPDLKG